MTEEQDKDKQESAKSFQEYLIRVTEEEFFKPKIEEQHKAAVELLERLEITSYGNRETSGYYNRKESILKPITWEIGRSEMKVYPVLVTRIFELANKSLYSIGGFLPDGLIFATLDARRVYTNKVEKNITPLGIYGLKTADPLARIIANAFQRVINTQLFYVQYYEVDSSTRFLRVYFFAKRVSIPGSEEEKVIISYLKFYKNGYPKPYGRGEDVVPL